MILENLMIRSNINDFFIIMLKKKPRQNSKKISCAVKYVYVFICKSAYIIFISYKNIPKLWRPLLSEKQGPIL